MHHLGFELSVNSGKHWGNRRGTSLLRGGGDHPSYLGDSREVSDSIRSRVRNFTIWPFSLSWPHCRTCFFVLGLISSTYQGAEILDDYHWEATTTPLAIPTGLCIPTDIDKFISVSSMLRTNFYLSYRCLVVITLDNYCSWDGRKYAPTSCDRAWDWDYDCYSELG